MSAQIVNPSNEEELVDYVKAAQSPFAIAGGQTKSAPDADVAVSSSEIKGIDVYEPGALTLVAKAGTPIEDIEATLASEGQRLAFEPGDMRGLLKTKGTPTLGGVMASNASGPRRIQTGAARDHLLGVRFVDGLGNVIENGGRVMKNVTGYDLVKLLAGSRGTLGFLTRLSLKVLPVPETSLTLRIEAPNAEIGVKVLSAALGSPYDVTGAAWVGGESFVRIEGFEGSVNYRANRLESELGQFGDVSKHQTENIWRNIRDAEPFHKIEGDVWRISVKPSDGPKVLSALPGQGFLDWGGGLVWVCVPPKTDVRGILDQITGHATLIRGQGHGPTLNPATSDTKIILNGIRHKFDPRSVFSAPQAVNP